MLNKKAKVLPIVILLALFGLYYFYNVNLAVTLPDEGWGRASKVEGASKYPMQQYSFTKNKEIHMYLPSDDQVRYTITDQNYKTIKETVIPVSIDVDTPVWGDGQRFFYLQDKKLQLYENGKSTLIDEEVHSFYPTNENILYWNEKEIYLYETGKQKNSVLVTVKDPISHVKSADGDGSILVATNPTPLDIQFYLMEGKELKELYAWSSSNNATIENILYDSNGQEASILIETFKMSQGERTNNANLITFNPKDFQVNGDERMLFADGSNGARLANPRYFNMRYLDGKLELLFVSEGQREGKKSGYNVYFANTKQDGEWVGFRRSTSSDTSLSPMWAGENHILWQTYGGKQYQTYGTFNGNGYVESSMVKTKEDYRMALYDFISGVFSSLIMLFFGMIWVIPSLIFYTIMMFLRKEEFENHKGWIEPVGILLYVGTVLYVFNSVLSDSLFSMAPDYLTFPNSMVIWPLVISIVSYGIYKLVTNKDMGLYAGISYYIGLNIVMMTGLYGPYLI